jgi:uncharacterized protein YecT (DUF1311 family)
VPQVPEAAAPAVPAATAAPAASAAPPAAAPSAAELLARAEKCIEDPTCSEDAPALYRQADDANAPGLSCFRFYYGIGIEPDAARARSCFERHVVPSGCGNSSPDLERLYLGTMLIDAQGGPADADRARRLFDGCFADIAVTGVLAEIPKHKTLDPKRKPLDFCRDIGGTTLSMGECASIGRDRAAAESAHAERAMFQKLDPPGKELAAKAREAFRAYSNKQSELFSDKYRGGTLRNNTWATHENMLQKARSKALERFSAYKPDATADPAKAERDLDQAYANVCKSDEERKKLCAASRQAWTTYRDAEAALYAHVHGAAFGADPVTRDVHAALTRKLQADLVDMTKN